MITAKFQALLEEFHRKRWFPEKYPDPFGEFGDYISEGMVSDLLAAWQKEKRGTYLDTARYILQLLPQVQFYEAYSEFRRALADPLSEKVTPEFAFYWIRNSSEDRASRLWKEFQHWSDKWQTVLFNWNRAVVDLESNHASFHEAYAERLQLSRPFEEELRASRELFEWHLLNRTKVKNYKELLQYYRLERWKDSAQWDNLSALARSVAETCGIPQYDSLQTAQNPSVQYLFPIDPPSRTVLEYGQAKGPFDAIRFLTELGKSFFYGGMNPQLSAEEKICGDPSIPWFWGFTFASLLTDPEAVKTFIGPKADSMPEDTGLALQCWYRQELFLALYRSRSVNDLDRFQDHYTALWELAFPVETPSFLFLYDLSRSTESTFRAAGLKRSQIMIRHLRMKYGSRWFTEKKWTQRAREYWWEGYRLTTADILSDLQVPDSAEYPFGVKS